MKRSTFLISLFFIVFSILYIQPIQAQNETWQLNLTDIPVRLAGELNIDVFAGQLICTVILLMVCLLPVTIIARSKKASWIPEATISLAVVGACVAIQWIPLWFLLVLCLLVAVMMSSKLRDWIGGK